MEATRIEDSFAASFPLLKGGGERLRRDPRTREGGPKLNRLPAPAAISSEAELRGPRAHWRRARPPEPITGTAARLAQCGRGWRAAVGACALGPERGPALASRGSLA